MTEPRLVQAIYSFKGRNNDELCFKKGDVLTVTQAIDGGWWEGTVRGVTGWFPSNHVRPYKPTENGALLDSNANQQHNTTKMYRLMVLRDIRDTELKHIHEMEAFYKKYLVPMHSMHIVPEREYRQIVGNLDDVIRTHKALYAALESENCHSAEDQRVGGIFLSMAPQMNSLHQAYCSNHPYAVKVIEKHKNQLNCFMEQHGAVPNGLLVLSIGLSAPFKRVEKYPALLAELQRHTPEGDVDRGDTQRSLHVFREISSNCSLVRRQREMELEVLTGNIEGWDEGPLMHLGDIQFMSPIVCLWGETGERKDYYLVLFPQLLILLSLPSSDSCFRFQVKVPLSSLSVVVPDNGQHRMIELHSSSPQLQCTALFHTSEDFERCRVKLMQNVVKTVAPPVIIRRRNPSPGPPPEENGHHSKFRQNEMIKSSSGRSGVSAMSPQTPVSSRSLPATPKPPVPNVSPQTIPPTSTCGVSPMTKSVLLMKGGTRQRLFALRPLGPSKPVPQPSLKEQQQMLRRGSAKRKDRPVIEVDQRYQGDMQILKLIEAYCVSSMQMQIGAAIKPKTIESPAASSNLSHRESPIVVHHHEQPQTPRRHSNDMHSDLALLKKQVSQLQNELAVERDHRKRLEMFLRQRFPNEF